MARKRLIAKKRAKSGAGTKGHRRPKRHGVPKAPLELTNYLLESHPEFGN
jgi:hypothetical protein